MPEGRLRIQLASCRDNQGAASEALRTGTCIRPQSVNIGIPSTTLHMAQFSLLEPLSECRTLKLHKGGDRAAARGFWGTTEAIHADI